MPSIINLRLPHSLNAWTPRGETIIVCALIRNGAPWLRYLAWALDDIGPLFAATPLVLVEDGSDDGSACLAAKLVDTHGGCLVKFGPDSERSRLPRTTRLGVLRRRALAESLACKGDWILFIDTDIHFSRHTLQALLSSAERHQRQGLFTAYTLGTRVLARLPGALVVKSRGPRENHYFDTFALELDHVASQFPKCPFKGCRKCGNELIDPAAMTEIPARAAFGGMALIDRGVLAASGANWPQALPEDECEHKRFCKELTAAGVPTFVVSAALAYCNR